jgi:hypothetical protein
MTVPSTFPAWLSKPGQPDAIVYDRNSYIGAAAQGYVYPTNAAGSPVVPRTVLTPTLTVAELTQNTEQDDGRPLGARSLGSRPTSG